MTNLQKKESMVKLERYYMKTRGKRFNQEEANLLGIKRVYNYTSDLDFMDRGHTEEWSEGLYDKTKGEAVIIESAIREVHGGQLYVMSCIVFYTLEQCNLYYVRNQGTFKHIEGFHHLLN